MKQNVLISIGSNIDRQSNMRKGIAALRRCTKFRVIAVSPIYQSLPVGKLEDDPIFLNAAVWLQTELSALALRNFLRTLEADLGRVRTADKNAPRPIDFDIAMIDQRVYDVDGHHIPDPEIVLYPHLALPLADIAGDWVHPEHDCTLRQIAAQMTYPEDSIFIVEEV